MEPLTETPAALLEAAALAARGALLGGAAFLVFVANPMARRLPEGQGEVVMARTQLFLRLAALATAGLAVAQLLHGQFGALMVALLALAILVLAPREGHGPRLAMVILMLALVALLLAVTRGDFGRLGREALTASTALREIGAALWMGNLPLLWMLLRPRGDWPPAVAQALGARHAGLMLAGMALAAGGLALAWPERALLWGEAAFPLAAITLAMLTLALLAALLRVALLAEGMRAGMGPAWLARLAAVVEAELLLALSLCGPIVALFALAAGGLEPAAAPDLGALWPRFGLHAPKSAEIAGLALMLMAMMAWLYRAGGAGFTRLGPLLLLLLGLLLGLRAETGLGQALAGLILLAGLAEAWRLWTGRTQGLALALPFAIVAGLVLVLASGPPAAAMLPCLLALAALLIRWVELRLPGTPEARLAGLAWPFALGALGLVLTLSDGS